MRRALTRFLGRLSVGRKLLLIFLLDMSAVLYISGILVNEKYLAIDFARKELAGNAYIAALHQGLLASAAVGPVSGIAEAAQAVTQAEQTHGAGMASAELSQAFEQALRTLAARPADPQAASAALGHGRALITRVGNQSNLILDPDLDSYYTMSLIVLRLPELLDAVAGVTRHALQAKAQDGDDRARFLLLEGRLDTSRQALQSDYAEAFAAGGPASREALAPSRHAVLASVERYRDAARRAMGDDAAQAELIAAHRQLLGHLNQAWDAAGQQMERLTAARIDGFFARMWLHLGTALGLLALILSAVFFVARQIALPLQRLAGVTDKVRLSGDHSLRASWDSSDEIGRLVLGFNDMLAQLDRERVTQQELAARARAAQAQQQLVEAMPIPMMVTTIPGHQVLHANPPALAWLGGQVADPWRLGLEPAVRSRFFQQLADRDEVNEFEVQWRAGAEPAWAVLSARQLEFQGQSAVLTTFTPVNHLKFLERRLDLWAKVFESSSEGILIIDAEHRIVTANKAFCNSTGYELHELTGERVQSHEHRGSEGLSFLAALGPLLIQRGNWHGEVSMQQRDGTIYPAWLMLSVMRDNQQGKVSHFIATTIDISERKRSEERIRFLAQHDVLTELPNRSLCVERLRLALQQAQRRGDKVAVLFIDLDRFKNINDSLGHHIGDGLLRSVASRLLDAVRLVDTVSRLGGDEFVVVLNGVADAREVVSVVDQRLVPLVRQPHHVEGQVLQISCSVGVAIYPDDAQDLDTLMRHADVAMYQAKALGRDNAHFFTPELNALAQQRMKLESNLRFALDREELSLHYQPRVDARSGKIAGVEALLRWHSEELGDIAPTQFIPIAEDTRLIVPIGAWVIDEACRQMAQWRLQRLDIAQVSVNVSALQLEDDGLIGTLRAALERHALPPGTVELELTESALMNDAEQTLARLHAIKRLGVALAIDDFGTGYSSLNYLNRFPIERLKVDRSFVRDMFEDPTDLAITRAIIGLGHTLGLKVVAEGVETEREAQTLRAAGCDELQGFLLCAPLPAEALADWLQKRVWRRA